MKLGRIAEIRTGLVLSRKKTNLESSATKTYKLITLKSFHSDGFIDKEELDEFKTDDCLSDEYITQSRDVVIRLSAPYTAVAMTEELAGCVISSLFGIIRIKTYDIQPEYIAWYLNSKYTAGQIHREQVGSAIQVIKTSFLEELRIDIPTLDWQRQIAEFNSLYLREKNLLYRLIVEKETLHKEAMNQIFEMGIKER
jgi:restriction endonuclease S subunit